jgi:regulatory protein
MDQEPSLTVAAIRSVARGRQRVLELSDGREFLFSSEAIERIGGVTEGMPIAESDLQSLDAAELRVSAHEAALRLLASRPRSEKEMQTRLAMRGFPPEAIESEVERLRTTGLLDDSKFAAAWVEDRRRLAPRGKRMLRYELLGRGIDPVAVEQVTAGFDDREVALDLARKKARRAPKDSYETFVSKVGGFLRRRGFDYEVSAAATRTAWDEATADNHEGPNQSGVAERE